MKIGEIIKNKYEAFGFAESLIAIMISGIAATVLMSISANSMRRLMQAEDMDRMSQLAKSGAVIVQKKAREDNTIFDSLNNGQCFKLSDDQEGFNPEDPIGAETRQDLALESPNEDFFRTMCIVQKGQSGEQKVLVKITTGLVGNKGEVTNSSDTKDYTYFSIINIKND